MTLHMVVVNCKPYPTLRLALRALRNRILQLREKQRLRRVEKRTKRQRRRVQSQHHHKPLDNEEGTNTNVQGKGFSGSATAKEATELRVGIAAFPTRLEGMIVKTISAACISGSFYTSVLPKEYALRFGLMSSSPAARLSPNETSTKTSLPLQQLPSPPSRSYYKMVEAYARSAILQAFAWEGAVGIDLGAAPGGWSLFLAQRRCRRVYAVDRAKLEGDTTTEPEKVRHDVVSHINSKLQHGGLRRLTTQMREEHTPCLGLVIVLMLVGVVDFVCCDMNTHCKESLQHILLATPGAVVVCTLKFFGPTATTSSSSPATTKAHAGSDAADAARKGNVSRTLNEEVMLRFGLILVEDSPLIVSRYCLMQIAVWVARIKREASAIELFHLLTGTTAERTLIFRLLDVEHIKAAVANAG
eukprot:jgi/Bigna1/86617/estExt_fgenesh1_pg.C_120082